MTNDIIPNYHRSTFYEIQNGSISQTKSWKKKLLTYKLVKLTHNIIKYKLFLTLEQKIVSNTKKNDFIFSNFSINNINNCEPLNNLKNTSYKNKLGFDYLVYSKIEKCWPNDYRKAADTAIQYINKINQVVNKLESSLKIIIISPGWSFKNENSIGRLSIFYQFPNNVEITQYPLVKYLNQKLKNVDIIDTERLFNIKLSKVSNKCKKKCNDQLYFPFDGHWNENAHEYIFKILLKDINN